MYQELIHKVIHNMNKIVNQVKNESIVTSDKNLKEINLCETARMIRQLYVQDSRNIQSWVFNDIYIPDDTL